MKKEDQNSTFDFSSPIQYLELDSILLVRSNLTILITFIASPWRVYIESSNIHFMLETHAFDHEEAPTYSMYLLTFTKWGNILKYAAYLLKKEV